MKTKSDEEIIEINEEFNYFLLVFPSNKNDICWDVRNINTDYYEISNENKTVKSLKDCDGKVYYALTNESSDSYSFRIDASANDYCFGFGFVLLSEINNKYDDGSFNKYVRYMMDHLEDIL